MGRLDSSEERVVVRGRKQTRRISVEILYYIILGSG